MKGFGTVSSQTEQIDTSLVNIDYESESQRLAAYEREQADLNNVRFPTEVQNRRKEALHGLINTTRNNLDKLKDQENVLLYITLVPQQKNSNTFLTIKDMSINFLTWLVIYAVGMVWFTLEPAAYVFSGCLGNRDYMQRRGDHTVWWFSGLCQQYSAVITIIQASVKSNVFTRPPRWHSPGK